MDSTRECLQAILRDLFADPELVIKDETTAQDIDGWDSLAHINLIIAVERQFGIKFATSEISHLKDEGQNIGGLVRLIETKLGNR